MAEVNNIKVTAGDLVDTTVINRVAKADPNYKLKATDSKNWM